MYCCIVCVCRLYCFVYWSRALFFFAKVLGKHFSKEDFCPICHVGPRCLLSKLKLTMKGKPIDVKDNFTGWSKTERLQVLVVLTRMWVFRVRKKLCRLLMLTVLTDIRKLESSCGLREYFVAYVAFYKKSLYVCIKFCIHIRTTPTNDSLKLLTFTAVMHSISTFLACPLKKYPMV